jgi:uncharacterized protein YjbJ (UPF0337 family)
VRIGDLSDTLRDASLRPSHDRLNTQPTKERIQMATEDKAAHKAEDIKGKVKEATGKATDDDSLQAEGKTDQSKSSLKEAGENIKDAFKK